MSTRAMKFDLFVQKALEKKGYTVDELVQLSEEELSSTGLPEKILNQLREYKLRGAKTPDEVAKELAAIMEEDTATNMSTDVVQEVYQVNLADQQKLEIIPDEEITTPVQQPKEVDIIRVVPKADDIKIIKELLNSKDLKSTASYIKLIKENLPKPILDSVDSTVLQTLIDARLSELKEKAKANK